MNRGRPASVLSGVRRPSLRPALRIIATSLAGVLVFAALLAPIVTGENASHDVPITIVARDPKVLDRIAGWAWIGGLRPGPQAAVWRMDAFRDKFLGAYERAGPPTS